MDKQPDWLMIKRAVLIELQRQEFAFAEVEYRPELPDNPVFVNVRALEQITPNRRGQLLIANQLAELPAPEKRQRAKSVIAAPSARKPTHRTGGWPISRNAVRAALTRDHISVLHQPTTIRMVSGSAVLDWCRFEVPFARLTPEWLPMMIDPRTGTEADDEVKIARHIDESFKTLITDIEVERDRSRFKATFTLYVDSRVGRNTYQRRIADPMLPWDEWAKQIAKEHSNERAGQRKR